MRNHRKIVRGFYLTNHNRIIPVVIYRRGSVRNGKYMAKIGFAGKYEEETLWVDGRRVSVYKDYLERLQKESQAK